MLKVKKLEIGRVGLIQQGDDGRIIQIALTEKQSDTLQLFVAYMSQKEPLVQMSEEWDLLPRTKVNEDS